MNDRSDEPHDEFLSALYRETREAEPPSWLDRRILMMAKAAAEPRPAPVVPLPERRPTRWAVPLALAATVVLTVGVVRMVRESGEFKMPLKSETVRSLAKPTTEADAATTGRTAPLSAERELPRALPPAAPQILAPSVAPLPPRQAVLNQLHRNRFLPRLPQHLRPRSNPPRRNSVR